MACVFMPAMLCTSIRDRRVIVLAVRLSVSNSQEHQMLRICAAAQPRALPPSLNCNPQVVAAATHPHAHSALTYALSNITAHTRCITSPCSHHTFLPTDLHALLALSTQAHTCFTPHTPPLLPLLLSAAAATQGRRLGGVLQA